MTTEVTNINKKTVQGDHWSPADASLHRRPPGWLAFLVGPVDQTPSSCLLASASRLRADVPQRVALLTAAPSGQPVGGLCRWATSPLSRLLHWAPSDVCSSSVSNTGQSRARLPMGTPSREILHPKPIRTRTRAAPSSPHAFLPLPVCPQGYAGCGLQPRLTLPLARRPEGENPSERPPWGGAARAGREMHATTSYDACRGLAAGAAGGGRLPDLDPFRWKLG